MEIKEILLKSIKKVEKVELNSQIIKLCFFMTKFLTSVPILTIILKINYQIFQANPIQKAIENFIFQAFSIFSLPLCLGIIIYSTLSAFLLFIISKLNHYTLLKLCIIIYLLLYLLTPITSIFLLTSLKSITLNICIKITNAIALIIIQIPAIVIQKFWITFSFNTKNFISHKPNNFILALNSIQKTIFYLGLTFLLNHYSNQNLDLIYYFIIVLTNCIKLVLCLKEKYYTDQSSNRLEIIGLVFSLVFISLHLTNVYFNNKILENNYLITCLIMGMFASVSSQLYLSSREHSYIFLSKQQIVQSNQIVSYLESNFKLWKRIRNPYTHILISSLKKIHILKCLNQECYCKKIRQNQKNNQQQYDYYQFFKYYLQQILLFIKKHTHQPNIYLFILNFSFQLFKNSIATSRQINLLHSKSSTNLQIEFGLKSLSQKVYQNIEKNERNNEYSNLNLPIQLDQVLKTLQKTVFNDINIKYGKWQYLCKSICKSLEIEEYIVKEIQNISTFDILYHQNKNRFKKSLSFNALSLFYYSEVVFFHKEIQDLQICLKQIKSAISANIIINQRQISKFIFHANCCLIQTDLSQFQIDLDFKFQVTNCSRNIQNLFKFQKQNFIRQKIEYLYPKFLWNTQKQLFINYIFDQNNKNKKNNYGGFDNYFLDKNNEVFKAFQSIKLIPKKGSISMIFLLFLKEKDKFLILNENKQIQNTGRIFRHYFGSSLEGIPFQCLFQKQQEYEQTKFDDRPYNNTVSLIFGMDLVQDWKNFLDKIRIYMNKKMNNNSIKKQKTAVTLKAIGTRKNLYHQISSFIEDQKQKLFLNKSESEISQQQSLIIHEGGLIKKKSLLSTLITTTKCKLKNETFFQVSMDQIKRKKISRQRKNTLYSRSKVHLQPQLEKKDNKNEDIQLLCSDDHIIQNQGQEFQKDLFLFNQGSDQFSSIEQDFERQQQKDLFLNQNSSVQSSIRTDSIAYFYNNFVDICYNLFKNPKQIQDKRLFRFTLVNICIVILKTCLIIATYQLFNFGFYQIRDIFFADGAVSDNMQLTEFMYNRAMNFKQFKNDLVELDSIFKSAYYQREYVYGLMSHDLGFVLTNVTKMTQTKFYQYIKVPIRWQFLSNISLPIIIQSNQLLIYYYYLSREVQINIKNQTDEAQMIAQDSLELMKRNFPQMKRINHENLYLYKQMSDTSLELIEKLIILSGFVHVILSFVIFYVYYRQKIFRRKQQVNGYSIYKLIPRKIIQILFNHYHGLSEYNKSEKDLKKYETYFQRGGIYLPKDGSAFLKPNTSIFITNNFKSPFEIWRFSFVLLIINVLYAVILIQANQLAQPIAKMMINVNNLMDSENYLIENYIDLKAKFIIDNDFTYSQEFFNELLKSQQTIQVQFNLIAVQSLTLFQNYDDTYIKDFIDLLINDTCQLIKAQISLQEYRKCKSYFKIDFISNGVILGMNFFTRKIKQKTLQLKQILKNLTIHNSLSNQESIKQQILQSFNEADFREIDQSMIFMFKMYQATQSRIYMSLQKTIIGLMNDTLIILLIDFIIIGVLYPICLYINYGEIKIQLSKLYVSFLLIPFPISKKIKAFAGSIQRILEYEGHS